MDIYSHLPIVLIGRVKGYANRQSAWCFLVYAFNSPSGISWALFFLFCLDASSACLGAGVIELSISLHCNDNNEQKQDGGGKSPDISGNVHR
jgi:hypothetical protein